MNATRPASGRFLLRLDPALHGALRAEAEAAGLSLNEYCVRKLAIPGTGSDARFGDILQAATRVAGDRLVGVVLFGSLARGTAAPDSDVDVLVVLAADTPITRSLYRTWDERPLAWDGREVEPHFVALPPPGERLLGAWAEAALDGVVLFERDLQVSRCLAGARREIATGKILRRVAQGQAYWVVAA